MIAMTYFLDNEKNFNSSLREMGVPPHVRERIIVLRKIAINAKNEEEQAQALYAVDHALNGYKKALDLKERIIADAKKYLPNPDEIAYLNFLLKVKYQEVMAVTQNEETLSGKVSSVKIDLRKPPKTSLKAEKNMCYCFGDMHGSALKLLHIMMMSGAARFPQDRTKESYEKFLSIYYMKKSDWDMLSDQQAKHLLEMMDKLIDDLVINPDSVNLRLIGDVLADRGTNDYFTLRLVSRLIEAKPELIEIIFSNHDGEALERHHNQKVTGKDKYSDKNNKRYNDVSGQTDSILGLDYLLKRNLITQAQVDKLFHQYEKRLVLASYDIDPDNKKFVLHTHAPTNPVNIFMAALCLIDPKNHTDDFIDDEDRAKIKAILDRISLGESLTHGDLIVMIDILNLALSYALQTNKLSDVMDLKIQTAYQITVPNRDPVPMTFSLLDTSDKRVGPIQFLFESRQDPNLSLKYSNINVTECPVICTHGHVGTSKKVYFSSCENIDTDTAKFLGDEKGELPYKKTGVLTEDLKAAMVNQASQQSGPKI